MTDENEMKKLKKQLDIAEEAAKKAIETSALLLQELKMLRG